MKKIIISKWLLLIIRIVTPYYVLIILFDEFTKVSIGNDLYYDNSMILLEKLKLWSTFLILAISVVSFAIDKGKKLRLFVAICLLLNVVIFLNHIITRIYLFLYDGQEKILSLSNNVLQSEMHYLLANLIALFCLRFLTVKSN